LILGSIKNAIASTWVWSKVLMYSIEATNDYSLKEFVHSQSFYFFVVVIFRDNIRFALL